MFLLNKLGHFLAHFLGDTFFINPHPPLHPASASGLVQALPLDVRLLHVLRLRRQELGGERIADRAAKSRMNAAVAASR